MLRTNFATPYEAAAAHLAKMCPCGYLVRDHDIPIPGEEHVTRSPATHMECRFVFSSYHHAMKGKPTS